MVALTDWRRNGSDQGGGGGGGYHRISTSFFPCNAHRVNVKISPM